MKIIMQTRGDMRRFRTWKILTPYIVESDLTVVCHNPDQAERVAEVVPGAQIFCHNLPEGPTAIGPIRDWIEATLVGKDEWYIGIDDNIEHIYRVIDRLYYQDKISAEDCTRPNYRHEVTGMDIRYICDELRERAEKQGTIYGGFGWMENPMFRRTKWQPHGYAKAKLYIKKNVGIKWQWDSRIQVMYDHAQTFRVIEKHGSVAINRFVYVAHPQYEVGGLGSHAERMPFRAPTCEFLYEHFNGLVAPFRDDPDKPVVRLRGQDSIDRWRYAKEME